MKGDVGDPGVQCLGRLFLLTSLYLYGSGRLGSFSYGFLKLVAGSFGNRAIPLSATAGFGNPHREGSWGSLLHEVASLAVSLNLTRIWMY